MASTNRSAHRLPVLLHLAGVAVLSFPFLLMAQRALDNRYISDQHAHFLEKGLLAVSRGKLEVIGLVYPPIPFMLSMPLPHSGAISFFSAIIASTVLWLLCRRLTYWNFPVFVKVLAIVSVLLLPEMLFVATQSMSEVLGLLLLLLAWHDFIAFTRHSKTNSGFFAGMTLGAAFFVNHHVALYSLPFALIVPIYNVNKERGAAIASAFVLFFPMVIALISWLYLNWVFTGKSLSFLHAPGAAHLAYYTETIDSADIAYGFIPAVWSALQDVVRAPVYIFAGVVVFFQRPIRVIALLIPFFLISATRSFGLVYPIHFAILNYTLMGMIAIPTNINRRWYPAFVSCLLLQVALAYMLAVPKDMTAWSEDIKNVNVSALNSEEIEIGQLLAELPARSVLIDDRIAFRLIARSGTAEPFLVRADPMFAFAESAPSAFVGYIVTPSRPMDIWQGRIATQYVDRIPKGFVIWKEWSKWRILKNKE